MFSSFFYCLNLGSSTTTSKRSKNNKNKSKKKIKKNNGEIDTMIITISDSDSGMSTIIKLQFKIYILGLIFCGLIAIDLAADNSGKSTTGGGSRGKRIRTKHRGPVKGIRAGFIFYSFCCFLFFGFSVFFTLCIFFFFFCYYLNLDSTPIVTTNKNKNRNKNKNKNKENNPQNGQNKDQNNCMSTIIQLKYTLSNN